MNTTSSTEDMDLVSPDNIKGILWALLANGLFATVATMAKLAVTVYHALQILLFRQIIAFLSSLTSIAKSFPQSLKTHHTGLRVVRLIGVFAALSTSIWAVAVFQLTTAITLAFAQVFFVALLAMKFLGEPVRTHRIGFMIVGFVVVVIVIQPGVDGLFNRYSLIPQVVPVGVAFAVASVRKLSQTESTATLLVYQAVFVGTLASISLFWVWVTPVLPCLILLLAMGSLVTLGQWVGVNALHLGEASVIGNIQYMQLIYEEILGYVQFWRNPER